MKRPTVIIRDCRTYDAGRIQHLTTEALERLELRPRGRTLVKPNCVMSGEHFPHAYTRPEFLEGVLRALKGRAAPDLEEIALGERCGITVPTRYAFKNGGYYDMLERVGGVGHYLFEEVPQVEIPLYHEGRLRDSLFTPEPVARADFFVNCPKFKAHPWTTVTFSMKNYIGIQDDRHRLIDHDHKLNEKVADLQYIIQPQLIAIDAITAGEGRMLTPLPFDLGLVIYGDNQVAFDAVCCHIIGLDPLSVPHIRMAWERGFGPVALEDIQIEGDVDLPGAQRRAQGFRTGLIRVEDYFEDTRIHAYAGPPPGGGDDYCWGGCPGALEEAIEILRVYDKTTDDKLKPMHLVFGAYDGPINAQADEKVVFIGDCATWHGKIGGEDVAIPSIYKDRSTLNPHEARHQDALIKMAEVNLDLFKHRKDQVMRLTGCPASVASQVLLLVALSGLNNPYTDPAEAPGFMSCYLSWRVRTAFQRLMGQPYQRPGPTERGMSRPVQNLPPEGSPTPLER